MTSKHHLIPSVYAFLIVSNNKAGQSIAVRGIGQTAVFIRSGKHDRSNALSHRLDLTSILLDKRFGNFTHNARGRKKVLLLRSDNGPDEAPRNPSTQTDMIQLFLKLELVALILISLPAGTLPFRHVSGEWHLF